MINYPSKSETKGKKAQESAEKNALQLGLSNEYPSAFHHLITGYAAKRKTEAIGSDRLLLYYHMPRILLAQGKKRR